MDKACSRLMTCALIRLHFCLVGLALAAVLVGMPARAESTLFGQLERERSLSESYVGLLIQFGEDDRTAYAEGIRLYALAKADFDSLIEQLKFDLKNGHDLESSEKYASALDAAAERRVAFTGHVDDKVIAGNEDKRSGITAVLTAAPELIAALTETGETIWNAYVESQQRQQQQILDQLTTMKWKPFHEILASVKN